LEKGEKETTIHRKKKKKKKVETNAQAFEKGILSETNGRGGGPGQVRP